MFATHSFEQVESSVRNFVPNLQKKDIMPKSINKSDTSPRGKENCFSHVKNRESLRLLC